jgi:hypothetical protein
MLPQAHWCSLRETNFPEYEAANDTICLEKSWLISSE